MSDIAHPDTDARHGLAHDWILPTVLFAALGGMTWAVRGCSGFGAFAGCVFAGVTWGAAWWFLALNPNGARQRRYDSGWIVLALTLGIGLSGERGWMQWPSFFEGKLVTDASKGNFIPIPRMYGFLWLFIAGVPWAGLGACLLAWTGSIRETRVLHWFVRIAFGLGGAFLARWLFETYPGAFLPLYTSLEDRYHDLAANPSLRRLINDCRGAVTHLGVYLGLLLYEAIRREGKNVVLILTVGLVNGAGWALCQNWTWARSFWPKSTFNFWRCWESSGGISIGIAYGIAFGLVNRKMSASERTRLASRRSIAGPNAEWLLVFSGLVWLASWLLQSPLGGWGHWFYATLLVFAVAYHAVGRRRGSAEFVNLEPSRSRWFDGMVSLIPLLLAAALVLSTRSTSRWVTIGGGLLLLLAALGQLLLGRGSASESIARESSQGDPSLEAFGLALGLLTGLGLSIRNGLKGWCNIYLGNEDYWSRWLWQTLGPVFLVFLIALVIGILVRTARREPATRRFPHAYELIWLVLIVQNVIAQLVTGPPSEWNEVAFSIYYVLLFLLSATIVFHFQFVRERAR
ncbi:MAG: hypothetical protein U0794_04735 [Isosphaeraceae bacterium]